MKPLPKGLDIHGLGFTYPRRRGDTEDRSRPVLEDITLRVAPGELVGVLGPSGVGKTTLLRCIAGLERTYTGTVHLHGRALDPLPPHQRRVGMLFQEPALFPHLDVRGNVAFGTRYRTNGNHDRRGGDVSRWLELVGLGDEARTAVDRLSGGQRHRVALARTLAADPEAVLLDEPLASLDRPLGARIGREIRDILHQTAVPAIWVTHDEATAHALADRVFTMTANGTLEPTTTREAAP